MSHGDSRYLEAWKKPSGFRTSRPDEYVSATLAPSSRPTAKKATGSTANGKKDTAAPKASSLNVRLDTPGGVSYSPSDLSTHNIVKRTFIPYRIGEESDDRGPGSSEASDRPVQGAVLPYGEGAGKSLYDFGPDIVSEIEQHPPDESEARRYALSIDLNALKGRLEGGMTYDELHNNDGLQVPEVDEAASTTGASRMTQASTRTNKTMITLAASKPDSSLPEWFTRTLANSNTVPFIPPSSFTKRPADVKRPWDAMRWHGHRAFERPSQRDDERGIAAFEDINGPGRVPGAVCPEDDIDETASMMSKKAKTLSVADLFVVDPRRLRPLRMVRRADPGQVLLLCNGCYLSASEVASKRAAKAARDAGLTSSDAGSTNLQQTEEMLKKLSLTSEPRGGIGVLFCPNDDPLNLDESALLASDPRFEANTSKRLEAAPDLVGANSKRRAELRAVLAALELTNWEEEGFDKIVIGVEQEWIVRGITTDIWRWRHTDWKLTDHSAQGVPGDTVPDRDLWELIDEAVSRYESIDCNVRFWRVSPRDASMSKALAEMGALKDVPQRQGIVRWRKKAAPVLAEAARRKEAADKAANAKAMNDKLHGRKPV